MVNRLLFIAVMWFAPQFAWAVGALEIFSPVAKPSARVAADMAALSLPIQAATPVKLNIAELAALAPNAEVNFTLPGNRGSYPVVYERMETAPGGNVSWIGYLKAFGKNYRAILTNGPGGAYGRILTPEGEFKLHSVAGSQWLIDTAAANLKPFTTKEDDSLIPSIAASLPKQGEDLPVSAAVTPSPQTTIDLMVLYTPGLVTRLGSVSAAQARIANLVAISNQAYIDSEVAITLRLVHTAQVNYSDSATQSAALNALTGGTDPALAGVATLRTTYGADLVMLMRPFILAMNSCGLAWIGGSGNTPISGYAAYGYSAVLDGTDGGSYCSDFTFVHELGHNMGSVHDRVTHSIPTGPSTGAYSYSFGYGVNNAFTTVMAYPSSYTSAPRIGRFSNPYLYTCGGMACGVSETASNSANNALSLNNTRAGVANFKPSVTAQCTYTLSSSSFSTGAATAIGNVSVTTTTGCAWTARSNVAWITITSGASGTGNGSVGYSIAANIGASRTGTLTIAGKTFTVTQNGAGTLPSAPTIGTATAGNGSVRVAFTPGAIGSGTLVGYTAMCGSITATGTSPIMVLGLTNGIAYTCKVRTTSTVGIGPWSALSNSVTPSAALLLPAAPIIGVATPGNGTARVAFTPGAIGSGTLLSYTAMCGSITATGISPIMVLGLTNGRAYTCKVRTTSTVGIGPWSVLSNTVTPSAALLLPAAPIIGTATAGNASIRVAFTPGAIGGGTLLNYTAMCGSRAATGTASPIMVPGLNNGTAYTCKVRTTSSVGIGPWSALSNAVTPIASLTSACTAISPMSAAVMLGSPSPLLTATCSNSPTSYIWKVQKTGAATPATLACTGRTCTVPTASLATAGTYTVTVKANNAAGVGTVAASATVSVSAPLLPACSAIAPATASVTLGAASPLLTATCSNSPTAYVWKVGTATLGCTGRTCTVPAANLPAAGTYTVMVKANNAAGAGIQATGATVTVTAPAAVSSLNDTGITASQCYEAGSYILVACNSAGALALNNKQDGMAGRDANPATNSNTDGKLGFSFAQVAGGCVLDNVTGLMWEVKTTDGGLRDWNWVYTNYSPSYDPSGLYGAATDATGFVAAVNAAGLCGYSDWRLPTADELQGIVDYGLVWNGTGAIDATWFPNTIALGSYWSSSPKAGYSSAAWPVDFAYGDIGGPRSATGRNHYNYVRLVRAGQSPTTSHYTVSADGQEVTDNQARLIWRRCAEGMSWNGTTCAGVAGLFTHEAALQHAAAQAGSAGWRLPDIKELASIADRSRNNPAIDPTAFPATPTSWHWSSSPFASGYGVVWYVGFSYGEVSSNFGNSANGYVRLVRAGQ